MSCHNKKQTDHKWKQIDRQRRWKNGMKWENEKENAHKNKVKDMKCTKEWNEMNWTEIKRENEERERWWSLLFVRIFVSEK